VARTACRLRVPAWDERGRHDCTGRTFAGHWTAGQARPAVPLPWPRPFPETRLIPLRSALLILLAPVGGCTPLGAWVYDAPRFTVAEIHAAPPERDRLAFEFVLTGCNLNDYDLMADSLALQLNLHGEPVSSATWATPIALPMRDSTRVTIAVTVPSARMRELKGGGEGDVPFALHAVSTVRTPMGLKVVDGWQRGSVRLKADTTVGWTTKAQIACRPGSGWLPPAEGRGTAAPAVRGPEMARPQPPPTPN
jgi:hypothetical protein